MPILNPILLIIFIVAIVYLYANRGKDRSVSNKSTLLSAFIYLAITILSVFLLSIIGDVFCKPDDAQCIIISSLGLGGIILLAGVVSFSIAISKFILFFKQKK